MNKLVSYNTIGKRNPIIVLLCQINEQEPGCNTVVLRLQGLTEMNYVVKSQGAANPEVTKITIHPPDEESCFFVCFVRANIETIKRIEIQAIQNKNYQT